MTITRKRRPLFQQLGIVPELDGDAPADYRGTEHYALNQAVEQVIRERGSVGASASEIATALNRTVGSVGGRCVELYRLGRIRRTEIKRRGVVYVAVAKEEICLAVDSQ